MKKVTYLWGELTVYTMPSPSFHYKRLNCEAAAAAAAAALDAKRHMHHHHQQRSERVALVIGTKRQRFPLTILGPCLPPL